MADIRSFGRMLFENLPRSKARIEIISRLLLILDPMQTVVFLLLAHALSAPAQVDPNYKRPRRCFREIEPPYAGLPRLSPDYTPALNCTNRKVRSIDINMLMRSTVCRGIGFHVTLLVVPNADTSDTGK
jgi:hypothetical protein